MIRNKILKLLVVLIFIFMAGYAACWSYLCNKLKEQYIALSKADASIKITFDSIKTTGFPLYAGVVWKNFDVSLENQDEYSGLKINELETKFSIFTKKNITHIGKNIEFRNKSNNEENLYELQFNEPIKSECEYKKSIISLYITHLLKKDSENNLYKSLSLDNIKSSRYKDSGFIITNKKDEIFKSSGNSVYLAIDTNDDLQVKIDLNGKTKTEGFKDLSLKTEFIIKKNNNMNEVDLDQALLKYSGLQLNSFDFNIEDLGMIAEGVLNVDILENKHFIDFDLKIKNYKRMFDIINSYIDDKNDIEKYKSLLQKIASISDEDKDMAFVIKKDREVDDGSIGSMKISEIFSYLIGIESKN